MKKLTNAGGPRENSGRPPKYDEPATTFSFFGPCSAILQVDAAAQEYGLSRSGMIVEILSEWLLHHQPAQEPRQEPTT